MIADKEISIVVQGPIIYKSIHGITQNVTQFICDRAKELFPESELILSTWEGENVEGINYDKLVLSKDPGAYTFNYDNPTLLNNCNRMIVSTLAGIEATSRKFVFKIRSDLYIVSKKFLTYFHKYPLYNDKYKFVKDRIICFTLNTLYGHKTSFFTMNRPFHISDWAYFGHKSDLLNLYDVPLVNDPEFSQWFLTRCKNFYDIEPCRLWKMPPEQYITYNFLNKFTPIELEHTADDSNDNMALSAKLLTNNFLILDQTQFALVSLKYLYFVFSSSSGYAQFIFHKDWLRQYCSLMDLSAFDRFKLKLVILFRATTIPMMNGILGLLNQNNQMIARLCALRIKKNKKPPK